MLQKISLRVPSNLHALATVLAWFEQLRLSFSQETDWEQCRIALAEGFTNAVKHAHGNRPEATAIELQAICSERKVEIQIWDQGQPFDLSGYLKTLSSQGSDEAESGRGLRLIREIADQVSYTRTSEGRNCLTMRKWLHSQEQCRLSKPSLNFS